MRSFSLKLAALCFSAVGVPALSACPKGGGQGPGTIPPPPNYIPHTPISNPPAGYNVKTCTGSIDCVNVVTRPSCAAPSDNACMCQALDGNGNCSAGWCLWHIDISKTNCTTL